MSLNCSRAHTHMYLYVHKCIYVCVVTILRWVYVDYDRDFQNPSDFTVFIQMLMNLKRVYGVGKTWRGYMRQAVKLPLQEVVMIKNYSGYETTYTRTVLCPRNCRSKKICYVQQKKQHKYSFGLMINLLFKIFEIYGPKLKQFNAAKHFWCYNT